MRNFGWNNYAVSLKLFDFGSLEYFKQKCPNKTEKDATTIKNKSKSGIVAKFCLFCINFCEIPLAAQNIYVELRTLICPFEKWSSKMENVVTRLLGQYSKPSECVNHASENQNLTNQ